ncbi:MAG: hypothetical protein RL637_682 [Pseudomonadota bacterium]|jgi:peroxiredoxin
MKLKRYLLLLGISCSVQGLTLNHPVPDCQLKTTDHTVTYQLHKARGQVLYVDFWASWCTSCLLSFPFMNKLHQDLREQGLEVIAINMDEVSANADEFLQQHPAHFRILSDTNEQCAKAFAVKVMPSSYLIDRNGIIRYEHIGFKAGETENLRMMVKQLLAEPLTKK